MSQQPSRDVDKVQVGYHRAENTETVSSPHTYAYSSGKNVPSTTKPDQPDISNIRIVSAMSGLPPAYFAKDDAKKSVVKKEMQNEEEAAGAAAGHHRSSSASPQAATGDGEGRTTVDGFPWSTRRVERMSFEMHHVSPPIANLFRRVLTTEVPTLAFDRVLIEENDSPVLDELLSHRLGLVPVAGPVMKMDYITESTQAGFNALDPRRVLLFELDATGAKEAAVTPVYSRQLQWVPLPGQEQWSAAASATSTNEECGKSSGSSSGSADGDDSVFLVHPDILITKLGPGQRLKLKAIAVKGIGSVHAKWSPVSACYYEMRTSVELRQPLTGDAAAALVKCCPMGVFGIDAKQKDGAAMVVAPEKCTLCRECLRSEDTAAAAAAGEVDRVSVQKDKTNVLFHIESVGQLHPAQILRLGLRLFAERCRALAELVQSTEVRVVDASAKALEH